LEWQENKKGEQMGTKIETAKNPRMEVLTERGKLYGEFKTHAMLTQKLKKTFTEHMELYNIAATLTVSEAEAIDMIFHKLGRIGNGDPHYKDSWIDIAGYATLVVEDLEF
jgi:hypothetical protein